MFGRFGGHGSRVGDGVGSHSKEASKRARGRRRSEAEQNNVASSKGDDPFLEELVEDAQKIEFGEIAEQQEIAEVGAPVDLGEQETCAVIEFKVRKLLEGDVETGNLGGVGDQADVFFLEKAFAAFTETLCGIGEFSRPLEDLKHLDRALIILAMVEVFGCGKQHIALVAWSGRGFFPDLQMGRMMRMMRMMRGGGRRGCLWKGSITR